MGVHAERATEYVASPCMHGAIQKAAKHKSYTCIIYILYSA